MDPERREFLCLANLPARLTITEASWLLGFRENELVILTHAGLLKPLGHPAASGSKYFATCEIQHLRSDTHWLAKASDATVKFWRRKNESRVSSKTAVASRLRSERTPAAIGEDVAIEPN